MVVPETLFEGDDSCSTEAALLESFLPSIPASCSCGRHPNPCNRPCHCSSAHIAEARRKISRRSAFDIHKRRCPPCRRRCASCRPNLFRLVRCIVAAVDAGGIGLQMEVIGARSTKSGALVMLPPPIGKGMCSNWHVTPDQLDPLVLNCNRRRNLWKSISGSSSDRHRNTWRNFWQWCSC